MTWTVPELDAVAAADELGIASLRDDGSLRPFITIWSARVGDEIYVRSAHGVQNPWFHRAVASGSGRIRAGGIEKDVAFERVGDDRALHELIDAEYWRKYAGYNRDYVAPVTGQHSYTSTLRLAAL